MLLFHGALDCDGAICIPLGHLRHRYWQFDASLSLQAQSVLAVGL